MLFLRIACQMIYTTPQNYPNTPAHLNHPGFGLLFVCEIRPFQNALYAVSVRKTEFFAHPELFIPRSGFLQTPPRDGRGCPCLWLTVPTAKSVADFHCPVVTSAESASKITTNDIVTSCVVSSLLLFAQSYFTIKRKIIPMTKNEHIFCVNYTIPTVI